MGIQIPVYGDDTQPTPHLSKLAAEGVVFEVAHVTAASCAPSRGSLHSGLYPTQNGILGFVGSHGYKYRSGLGTFEELLHDSGYTTGLTYKTGVEASPGYQSSRFAQVWDAFDDFRLQTSKLDPFTNEPQAAGTACSITREIRKFEHFLNRTVIISTPFFFLGQILDTHVTGGAGNKTWTTAATSACSVQPGMGDEPIDPSTVKKANFAGLEPYKVSAKNKRLLAGYYDAVQRVDYYVGKMLGLLRRSGHEANTLTIFSSDHGISHTCKGKITPYEGGLRVPLIMRWPGRIVAPGTRSNVLVSVVDFAPTILEAAGLMVPGYYPGHSVVPVLEGAATATRQYLFSAYTAHTTGMGAYWPTRTVRDIRFKLIQNIMAEPGPGNAAAPMASNTAYDNPKICPMGDNYEPRAVFELFELYDLVTDPHETVSMIGEAGYIEIEGRLKAALEDWRRRVLDDPFLDVQCTRF
jgi:N-sulfoglucosamine sulfohydrolase